jgi:hypothetical protein
MTVKTSITKLNDAMDAMRGQDARLIQTFSYYGKPDYWIAPSGSRVEAKIAGADHCPSTDRRQGRATSRTSSDVAQALRGECVMTILTQHALSKMGCGNPDCTSCSSMLVFNQLCHLGGQTVMYEVRSSECLVLCL